jgi:P4 family phage/plasmid primase-like protien
MAAATINEKYAKHPISKFLGDRYVEKGAPHSLTGMGKQQGRWLIEDKDYPVFLNLLDDYLFKRNGLPLNLVEQRSGNNPYPVLIDLDFKYRPDMSLNRMFSDKHIYNFVKGYSKGILKFYKGFPNGPHIRFFVSIRPQPYRNKRSKDGETFAELKDGIHIQSPDLIMNAERQRILRRWILDQDILTATFDGTEYINKPDDIFDESLTIKNGWLLYGESKPPMAGTEFSPYKIHKIYVLDTESGDIDEAPNTYTNRELIELLSIRYNLQKPLGDEHQNNDVDVVNDYKVLQAGCAMPKTPVHKPRAPAVAPEILDLEPIVADYLYPPQTERDMVIIRRLVLECLSDERADKYSTWRETEWCLRNISDSEEFFRLWIDFSKKSGKASNINVEREFREWKRGAAMSTSVKQLTKRSLHYWAREDNPQKYSEIIKGDAVEWVSQGRCKNTHNHVAQLINLIYDGDYRVAMDSQRVVWYRYKKNMWQQSVQAVDLRIKISNEVADIVSEARKVRKQWLTQQGTEDPGNDLIVKELLAIEKNLYTGGFKDSTMKEAASIFYEEDFEKKLNANTTLIGCANVTLNLRSKRVLADGTTEEFVEACAPKPEDYISFMAGNNPPDMLPIEYYPYSPDDPNIPEIMEFFSKIFPRPELREYVLTLLSSCIEGANREQAYYIMTGGGSNGKSKLVELMRYSLGDYLTSLSTTAITRKRPDSGSANPDIIKIRNKRAIIMQEPDPNEPLNTSRMKQFSGEDDVEARGLFKDQETFKITGKLFMSCNKLPPINTMDNGTWRRIRVIPFETRFVDTNDPAYDPANNVFYKDYKLDDKLKSWRQSFFSLLVYYYETRYLKGGLNPPPIVMHVSNQYKYTHDSFAKFFESCVRKEPEAPEVTFTKIYKMYSLWYTNLAGASGTKLKSDDFKKQLEEKLNIANIGKNVRGIQLFSSEEEAEDFDKNSVGSTRS